METQTYYVINQTTNICDNIVMWDGSTATWALPTNCLMLLQSATPVKSWVWDAANKQWAFAIQQETAEIGYTWDGVNLVTNKPQPANQPVVTGAQTL